MTPLDNDDHRPGRAPLWFAAMLIAVTLATVAVVLGLMSDPAPAAGFDSGHYTLALVFAPLAAFMAWRSWSSNRAVAWILLIFILLVDLGLYTLSLLAT